MANYGQISRQQLQVAASASAEQAVSHDWHSHDHDQLAAVLLSMALGSGVVRGWMDASIRWPRDRRKPAGFLSEPRLFLHWPMVVDSSRRSGDWSSKAFHVRIAR